MRFLSGGKIKGVVKFTSLHPFVREIVPDQTKVAPAVTGSSYAPKGILSSSTKAIKSAPHSNASKIAKLRLSIVFHPIKSLKTEYFLFC